MPPGGGGVPGGQPAPAAGVRPRRVVVWQHGQARPQQDGAGFGDGQHDTVYGRLLIRAQLGLSLMCLALAVTLIASLPLVAALLPGVRRVTVAGLPLTLLVLGAGIYPVFLAVGWFYNRQASQLERRFTDLAAPAGRQPDD